MRTINKPKIVFMGTYPPRECGIATFTQDLLHSSQKYLGDSVLCKVAAMNLTRLDTYLYPPEVEWKIDQNNPNDYLKLAEKINSDETINGIVMQHEYGIYGREDGKNILVFLKKCTKPVVVTLHTVLPHPTIRMKRVTLKIIKLVKVIIVLTENSKTILESVYPESVGKVHVIPHGIHPTKFSSTTVSKKRLKLSKRIVLSTFGLLNRGKGIEYVINSLPKLIKKYPSIIYLVLGETHPVVRRFEGERYRIKLLALVEKLNLTKHVKFYDQYLTLTDLIKFLKATDIYISTSINQNQSVSGTLSYALGTGRAVISTAFAQANEIVKKDSGLLVPIKNSEAFGKALTKLLSNKIRLKKMHRNAYKITRPMLWSNVSYHYLKLLNQNILPPINLTHLKRMTDDFGLIQFAKFDLPEKDSGYTLDDNSRALIVCARLGLPTDVYLNFIEKCQQPDGTFINYIDKYHNPTIQNSQEDLEDCMSRAMWALSELPDNEKAKKIFIKALHMSKQFFHIRSTAYIIKAFANFHKNDRKYKKELLLRIETCANFLVDKLSKNTIKDWVWFDNYLGYNNAILPEALLIAGKVTKNNLYIDKGIKSLSFLIQKTFSKNYYIPIGQSFWYKHKERRSEFDQQPEDPASMILALDTAYKVTGNKMYKKYKDICFSWFMGNNSLKLPLYDYKSGGCFDGLHPDRVNLNQGAESLVSYLLSRIAVDN
ncbi:MAG TPA: glycosyltransferase [Patescibacteria group bacterium]|nr:glycosyltransferase [Patescibacteria group bacterium]